MSAKAVLEELAGPDCLRRLRGSTVGRIAIVEHGFPVVVPVNYRVIEFSGRTWLAVRTRVGNVLDRKPAASVALEIDSIDIVNRQGWSVLVRGTLHHVSPDVADFGARFDPMPWLDDDRDAWLLIEPFEITGRRITDSDTAAIGLIADDDESGDGIVGGALDRAEALTLLASAEFGHLNLTRGGLPRVVPARYVVASKDRVLIHAASGTDTDGFRHGEIVALHVDEFRADRRAGWSVLVTGAVEVPESVEDNDVRRAPWLLQGSGEVIAVSTEVICGEAFSPTCSHTRAVES